jgi:hypothetical protein
MAGAKGLPGGLTAARAHTCSFWNGTPVVSAHVLGKVIELPIWAESIPNRVNNWVKPNAYGSLIPSPKRPHGDLAHVGGTRQGLLWYMTAMKWASKFPKQIVLKDGRAITSLIQARDLLVTLPPPHLKNSHWQYATDLLYDAAHNGDVVGTAYEQFLRALTAEGLI